MANPDLGNAAHGRLYRVGKHWYLDTALLQAIARRITVEPMQGGYQILAPAGLLRCTPATGLPLPGQTGDLFRCHGQSPEQDVGARLRKLADGHGVDVMGGEWDQWPGGAAAPATSCGCTSCAAGGACPCNAGPHAHAHDDDETQTLLERLIVSETLGTVLPRVVSKGGLALYPAQHAAPEWAAGRYHECIGSILRFPDLAFNDWIVLLDIRTPTISPTWGITLDRQRTAMLGAILQWVETLAQGTARKGSVRPVAPSKQTPGAGAWEMAAALADDFHRAAPRSSLCSRCPYRLGTNLRCPTCRAWQLGRKPTPTNSQQEPALIKLLTEHTELRKLRPSILRSLAQVIVDSHKKNPHEPLTDRFFVALERDILVAGAGHNLQLWELDAFLEVAELSPFEPQIAVGTRDRGSCETCGTALTSLGAHGIGCPRCADDEMNAMDAEHHP
ncbi:MAG: hypothetical protein H0T76_00060 [Nannocystis sp.]|nr:hypothetical protein [Nannocystis sp.]MBA3544853.1 hypothetical protein [Nannocystis sp.]